jgi:hypothetical protein
MPQKNRSHIRDQKYSHNYYICLLDVRLTSALSLSTMQGCALHDRVGFGRATRHRSSLGYVVLCLCRLAVPTQNQHVNCTMSKGILRLPMFHPQVSTKDNTRCFRWSKGGMRFCSMPGIAIERICQPSISRIYKL